MFIIYEDEDYLAHKGTPHEGSTPHSGRYEWGSGKTPYEHEGGLRGFSRRLRNEGLTDTEIAKYFGWSVEEYRIRVGVEKEIETNKRIARARDLMLKYNDNKSRVAREMGISEGTVRKLLKPQTEERNKIMISTAEMLKQEVEKYGPTDIGKGMQDRLGISEHNLNKAVAYLEQTEGFQKSNFKVKQVSTNKNTTLALLYSKDQGWGGAARSVKDGSYHIVNDPYSEDGGRTWEHILPPQSISSKRVFVRYNEEGGAEKDGLIEIRPGVEDLDMGRNQYAQVRIAVDGTHFMKGMAIYNPDLPEGIDIIYNSNKHKGASFDKVFKPMKRDPDDPTKINMENPFGAAIKANELNDDKEVVREVGQRHYIGKDGKKHLSCINIVNEQGDWANWSKRLSSQFLSKQDPELAKQQLGIDEDRRKRDLNEILQLTNTAVQRKLLWEFANNCDSAASKLKAAPLPGEQAHVLIPIPSLKDDEVYAPNYPEGSIVTLLRHPHEDISELPTLRVTHRNKEARTLIGAGQDAVGINKHNADILSGADFDGDTVLVLPNPNGTLIKNRPQLEALKDFDTKEAYGQDAFPNTTWVKVGPKSKKEYDANGNLIPHDGFDTQKQMGIATNLITDMQIQGCSDDELARIIKYDMVVIDAEKHNLNWKQAKEDFGVNELHKKFQGKSSGGAKTLISQAKSPAIVPERRQVYDTMIDKETGKIDWDDPKNLTGRYLKVKNEETGKWEVSDKMATQKITKMEAAKDANELGMHTKMENIYANYANHMKDLADKARKEYVNLRAPKKNSNAEKLYAAEVASLEAKLVEANKNRPLERKAQALAQGKFRLWLEDNPAATGDDKKKHKGQFLKEARDRMGAGKKRIIPTAKEWEAIQAGAISGEKINEILNNSDMDVIRQLATPRDYKVKLSAREINYIKMLAATGRYNQSDIAEVLNISASTVSNVINS